MKKSLLVLLSFVLLSTFNAYSYEWQQNNTQQNIQELLYILDGEKQYLDDSGEFLFDMGSASAGRVAGNLKDVTIHMEHKPERPGCADICPEMIIITFKCKGNKDCTYNPEFPEFIADIGVITFIDIKAGKKSYQLLKDIQAAIHK